MDLLSFKIPVTLKDLFLTSSKYYYIKDAIGVNNIPNKLKEAKQSLKENGVEFIIDYFDVYIAVIINKDKVRKDLIITAYEDLHGAMKDLDKKLILILKDEKSLYDELKRKYLNVIKMLTYAYVNIIPIFDMKETSKGTIKKNKRNDSIELNVEEIIFRMNSILHQKINILWDPPVVEEPLIHLYAQICYYFIGSPSIKSHKDLCNHIFHLFGTLLRDHKYSGEFVCRLTELIKCNEHIVPIVCDGIKLLVYLYNAKDLVKQFVGHISEWQRDQLYQSYECSINCAKMLLEMSKLMPELMVEEVKVLVERFSNTSYNLIISFLNVITEVLLRRLSGPLLTEAETKLRNEFIVILNEHILHESQFVRVRVIQNWCRLQKEKAIPPDKHAQILQLIAYQIKDGDSSVRISALNCITSFLKNNPYSSEMNLTAMENSLEKCEKVLDELKEEILEKMWKQMRDDIVKTLEGNINEDDDNNSKEFNLSKQQVVNLVQLYLTNEKYDQAIEIAKQAVKYIEDFAKSRETIKYKDENEFLLKIMYRFFVHNDNQIAAVLKADTEDYHKLNNIEKLVKHYGCAVSFLEVLDSCTNSIKDLLLSVYGCEVEAAAEFFVTAYKYNTEDALEDILDMLYMIPRSTQDRKTIIIKAFQSILLDTDVTSISERSNIIVDRLVKFMTVAPFDAYNYFKEVISSWVADEVLDNNVIECLFEYFVQKKNVSKEESLKALQVLIMVAPAKNTIVTENLRMITELIFEKRGIDDMMLLGTTCELLAVGTIEQKFNNRKPLFKVKPTDKMWKNLIGILYDNFDKNLYFYDRALKEGTRFIYALCSKPDEMVEKFIVSVLKKIDVWAQPNSVKIKAFILSRVCNLLGEIGICRTWFLDDALNKKIKKRLYVATEEIKKQKREEHNNSTVDCNIANLNHDSSTDSVYFMSEGNCIYNGTTSDIIPFLRDVNLACPETYSPADYLIELVQLEKCAAIMKMQNGKDHQIKVQDKNYKGYVNPYFVDDISSSTFRVPFLKQFWILFKRKMLQISRSRITLGCEIGHHLICGIIVGLTFYGRGTDAEHLTDNVKLYYGIVIYLMFSHGMIIALTFPTEVKLLQREYFNRWYSLKAFFLATNLSMLPVSCIGCVIFSILVYWLTGQPLEANRMLLFIVISILFVIASQGFGLVIGSIFNPTSGACIGSAIGIALILLSAYNMGAGEVTNPIMKGLMNLSYAYHGYVGFGTSAFKNRKMLDCPAIFCLFSDPRDLLRQVGMEHSTVYQAVIYLMLFTALHRILAYGFLKCKLKPDWRLYQLIK